MPANENSIDDTDGPHVDGSTREKPPTDPARSPLDDPVPIDVTPVASLRPATVTAHQRRLANGGGENVYTTELPTPPTQEHQVASIHAPPPSRLDDRQITSIRTRIADRIRAWDRDRTATCCQCPRCGGRLR